MKILTTIRRWFARKPSAHALLRQVINEDGIDVDRFCTCTANEDDEHSAGCLVSKLVEWTLDYPESVQKQDECIAPPDRPAPPPAPPLTPEEIEENKKRMTQFVETVNALKTAINHYIVEPVKMSDEDRMRTVDEYAPHDFDVHLRCRRCGAAMRDVTPGPSHCAVAVTIDGIGGGT